MLKSSFTAYLSYNPQMHRFCIGDQDLHCGDWFLLRCGGTWYEVGIEMEHGSHALGQWYFLPFNSPQPVDCIGLPAKFRGDCYD